jgi:hypothetical protein
VLGAEQIVPTVSAAFLDNPQSSIGGIH